MHDRRPHDGGRRRDDIRKVGRQYCERAATVRVRDYTSGTSSGTSTDSEYTQEWRCPDVGSDASRSKRIARVEARALFDVSVGRTANRVHHT